MEHRPPAGRRIAWWWLVVLGLLIVLVGVYLLSHFVRIGPHIAIAYVWSGGLVEIGVGITAVGIRVLREGVSRSPRADERSISRLSTWLLSYSARACF